MNSPVIPTVDAAMLKAISVATDIHTDMAPLSNAMDTVRDVFRQEITTLKAALLAEDKSRKVALGELRAAIADALVDYLEDVLKNKPFPECHAHFWTPVTPWLDRLER